MAKPQAFPVASLFASLLSSLLYVDLAGNTRELWQVKSTEPSWGVPSRDGKYLAIPAPTTSSNVWMAGGY
jgi:hypothetical protein